jgi:ribonuclease HI
VKRFFGAVSKEHAGKARNVAGELIGVGQAIKWCEANDIPAIDLYYDYEGIEAWARGRWKAKQDMTQRYAQFMRQTPVKVRYHKVKAHTGDKWNEEADKLAKKGALSGKGTTTAKNSETVPSTDREALRRQLNEIATGYLNALREADIPADLKKIYSNETTDFARLELSSPTGELEGRVDIYHTAKKPMNPHFDLPPTGLKDRAEELWTEFMAGYNG